MENTIDKTSVKKAARKDFTISAVVALVLLFAYPIVQIICSFIIGAIGLGDKPYTQYLLILIPLHLICTPIVYFAFRKKSDIGIEKKSISPIVFLGIIPIIYTMVYIGSSFSGIITSLINDNSQQAVASITTGDSDFFRILVVGITAPIAEEILFRKLLIDRMAKHSQIWAVIFSSVSFGIFHQNFAQLFYATLIGLVLGFVYVKTGKILYTIALHMVVNLATSAIAANLMKLDSEVPLMLYSYVLVAFAILGIVLFCVKYRKFIKLKKNENLTSGEAAKCCLLNPVSIIYFIVGFGLVALTTITMLA